MFSRILNIIGVTLKDIVYFVLFVMGGKIMGNVLIIKNNDENSEIYKYAKLSLMTESKRYYNTQDNSQNENYIRKIKTKFGNDGLILFITYDGTNEIKDMFIGTDVEINDKNNVEYIMRVYLSKEKEIRTIESIIDKIDLDISKDFDTNCYVIMSDMDSLFDELRERVIAQKSTILFYNDEGKIHDDGVYQLNSLAQKDNQAIRIYTTDPLGLYRTEFQRDRERVVNCKAFRRMVDKAQIFSAEKGDYYRTRMTHSLEVNQIAKAIAYALKLNLDLTEAIALGHDLGHTPFGHQGERTLDDILCGKIKTGIAISDELLHQRCFGGFKHNYQSAKILTQLEEKYVDSPGLNVTVQVVEGVLKHTRLKPDISLEDFLKPSYIEKIKVSNNGKEEVCATLEGQTVAIADEIAQRGHDVDDALTSGVMSIEEFIDKLKISKCDELKSKIQVEMQTVENSERLLIDKKELKIAKIVSCIINYMINSTIEFSKLKIEENKDLEEITLNNTKKIIAFSDDVERVNSYLERVVQKKVICNNEVARADYNANMIVKTLFEKYYANPRLLHVGTIHKIFIETLLHNNKEVANSAINLDDCSIKIVNKEIEQITKEKIDEEKIRLYIQSGNITGIEKDIVIFEKRKILIRAIVDYIAGMTDGYALEEYEKLK